MNMHRSFSAIIQKMKLWLPNLIRTMTLKYQVIKLL